jgi:hypothetical protein
MTNKEEGRGKLYDRHAHTVKNIYDPAALELEPASRAPKLRDIYDGLAFPPPERKRSHPIA